MSYIPEDLRQRVIERANGCCEYCLISREDPLLPHQLDHIIARKHLGETSSENLCFSCYECNHRKGTDFASFDPATREFSFLFNPRTDKWSEHFRLEGANIIPLTLKGRVTVFLLNLNSRNRLMERQELIQVNRYPCAITGGE